MPKTHHRGRKSPAISEDQVAIICPTKDQPQKVKRLLLSICKLKSLPGQVIVADGGHNLKPLVDQFTQSLNLTCLYCPEPGQVLQRNHARAYLSDDIRIVLHIDDDNTLEHDALSKLLDFWNLESNSGDDRPLAGVSFNVIDLPVVKNSFFRRLFFIGPEPEGTISISGYARPFSPAYKNKETSWLLGGSTAWSRNVVDLHPHPIDFPTGWAVCEDLIYSYNLTKVYRLMIAKNAVAYHNESYQAINFKRGIFYGLSSVIMRYYFVTQHVEFKRHAFIWMTIGIAFGHLLRACSGNKKHAGQFLGTVSALIRIVLSAFTADSSRKLAERLYYQRPK